MSPLQEHRDKARKAKSRRVATIENARKMIEMQQEATKLDALIEFLTDFNDALREGEVKRADAKEMIASHDLKCMDHFIDAMATAGCIQRVFRPGRGKGETSYEMKRT